jgi:hypothetical protein
MIESRRTSIAHGLEVSFAYDPAASGLSAQWHPGPPNRLDGQAIRRYRAARDQFMRSIAAYVGGIVAVVDCESDYLAATLISPPQGGRA